MNILCHVALQWLTMESLCACCRKEISVLAKQRRLSNDEEVRISLLFLIIDFIHVDNIADLCRGGCICRHCFACLQCPAKLEIRVSACKILQKVQGICCVILQYSLARSWSSSNFVILYNFILLLSHIYLCIIQVHLAQTIAQQ